MNLLKKIFKSSNPTLRQGDASGLLPRISEEEVDRLSKEYSDRLTCNDQAERLNAFYNYRNGMLYGLDLRGNNR